VQHDLTQLFFELAVKFGQAADALVIVAL